MDINCEGRCHVGCYLVCRCYTLHCTNKNNLQITISHAMEVGLMLLKPNSLMDLVPFPTPHSHLHFFFHQFPLPLQIIISSIKSLHYNNNINCFYLLLSQFKVVAAAASSAANKFNDNRTVSVKENKMKILIKIIQ